MAKYSSYLKSLLRNYFYFLYHSDNTSIYFYKMVIHRCEIDYQNKILRKSCLFQRDPLVVT